MELIIIFYRKQQQTKTIAHVQYIKILARLQGFLVVIFMFGLVFFVLKSLLGIARHWSHEKFAILSLTPRSHVRILIHRTWAIENELTNNLNITLHELFKSLSEYRKLIVIHSKYLHSDNFVLIIVYVKHDMKVLILSIFYLYVTYTSISGVKF